MRQINKATIDLIVEFEGCKLDAYQDSVNVWTIGIGHTSMAGEPVVKAGMKITKEQAYELFRKDIVQYAEAVEKALTVSVNDNQFGAMVSLCYNVGPSNFKKSSVLKKTNAQDWLGAANAFLMWNKAGGKVLRGLTRRRKAEANLYLAKVVSDAKPLPAKPVVIRDEIKVETPLKAEVKPAPVVLAPNKTDIPMTPTPKPNWFMAIINAIFGKKEK